ncbi:discoidin domain-containing protein [Desulfonatronum thioautotrophicum]|uniref:discoidin domain-containing protein n=1 Tax=Desulfonatronum thioautotrophicum TaxID=617001 RepID=UPI0013791E1B|nr:discoidin domain-containing protein [Desulfonatronum thioautotrophicum]
MPKIEWNRLLFNRRTLLVIALLAVLLAVGVRVAVIQGSLEYLPVTTDESLVVLKAKRITEGELPLVAIAQPYQFPIESYLMAPFVNHVDRSPLGARFVAIGLWSLTLILLLWIARLQFPPWGAWPVLALTLFPSAYLLMVQFGYAMPHYSPAMVLSLAALLMALSVPEKLMLRGLVLVVGIGICSGLAFSNNMLALTMLLPAVLAALTRSGFKGLLVHTPVYLLGLGVGLVPYIAGIYLLPGAHKAVAGTRTFAEALERVWHPALSFTLPRSFGFDMTTFPDTTQLLGFGAWFVTFMVFIFCLTLLAATILSAWRIGKQVAGGKWPVLQGQEIFVATCWLTLAIFALSAQPHSHSFRYMLPILLSFPFLIGALYLAGGKWVRCTLGSLVIFLVSMNLLATPALLQQWKEPDFPARVMGTPDLEPTLAFLRSNDIGHCVAAHWVAYRVNFLTDEQIICSQAVNERFPRWPIPYKSEVDAAKRVAYVLTDRVRFLTPEFFENHMSLMDVTSARQLLGDFVVYHDFRLKWLASQDRRIDPVQLQASALHFSENSHFLVDGNPDSRWGNRRSQEAGEWVQVDFPESLPISRIDLDYTCYSHDRAASLNILINTESGWQKIASAVPNTPQPFEFTGTHPVYGRVVQSFPLVPHPVTDSVRIEIAEPNTARNWNICQVIPYKIDFLQ